MKLSFEKDHLMNGINIVLKAVPSKTTMPILECILIDAVSDEIKLTGNDMELGIETKVEGTILERGKIALDAKLFSDIIRKLNELGGRLSDEYKTPYLYSDFKKRNGYKRSIELSAQYGLYRQNYCGCIYSRIQAEKKEQEKNFQNETKTVVKP